MARGPGADEDVLLRALRSGDEDVFVRLVRAWSASMLRVARVHVADRAAAEDVVQETWVAVLHGIGGFRGESSVRTWAFSILTNRAKTRAMRARRELPLSALDGVEGPAVEPGRFRTAGEPWPGHWREAPLAWPEDVLLRAEARERVLAAIEALPPRQRAVISLRDVHGWEPREVCEVLELSDGNQRVLLHRARAAVRAALEEELRVEVEP